MDRRTYLVAAGGVVGAVTGGAALADATRADVLADDELTRARGSPVALETTITRDSVEYLEATGRVRENGHTRPFGKWARSECTEVGAGKVLSVVEDRMDAPVEGVGSGVRYLVFGPVLTVDHTVTRGRDGSVVDEPTVPLDRLIAVAPRTMTVTVALAGRESTTRLPVGVSHAEMSIDR